MCKFCDHFELAQLQQTSWLDAELKIQHEKGNFFSNYLIFSSETSWKIQKLESIAEMKTTRSLTTPESNVATDHWMCHNKVHPGYVVIDHLAHQILNHVVDRARIRRKNSEIID